MEINVGQKSPRCLRGEIWAVFPQLAFCCRGRDKTGVLGLEERKEGEGLWLIYLFPQPAQQVYYSECLLVLEAGVLGCTGGRKVGELCDPLGMGSGRKGRQQQVFCYTAGHESGKIGSGEQERCGATISPVVGKN